MIKLVLAKESYDFEAIESHWSVMFLTKVSVAVFSVNRRSSNLRSTLQGSL